VALAVALVSLATPLASETVRERWFDFPRTLVLLILPSLTFLRDFTWFSLKNSD
jgi:cytochrome d ubiquinol oxidase subunit II